MAEFKSIMEAIKSMDEKLNLRINNLEQQNNIIIEKFESLNKNFEELSNEQMNLRKDLTSVEITMEILKQKAIGCDVVFTGVPDSENLNTLNTVKCILNKYDVKLIEVDYHKLYRLKSRGNTSKYTPICLELNSKTLKGVIMAQRKKLGPVLLSQLDSKISKEDVRKIFVKHRLTPYFSTLLKEAYQFKDKYRYKFAWFQDSEILLKKDETSKPLRVVSSQDLVLLAETEDKS